MLRQKYFAPVLRKLINNVSLPLINIILSAVATPTYGFKSGAYHLKSQLGHSPLHPWVLCVRMLICLLRASILC